MGPSPGASDAAHHPPSDLFLARGRVRRCRIPKRGGGTLEAGEVLWWDANCSPAIPNGRNCSPTARYATAQEDAFPRHGRWLAPCSTTGRIILEWRDLPPRSGISCKRENFFGLIIPKEYGGLGFRPMRIPKWCARFRRFAGRRRHSDGPNRWSRRPAERFGHQGVSSQNGCRALPKAARFHVLADQSGGGSDAER